MATFILVHGGRISANIWNQLVGEEILANEHHLGQEIWTKIAKLLQAQSHTVFVPNLSDEYQYGLAEHIQEICNLIKMHHLTDIILVGHSYGGMVITGIAERLPECIKELVYLDAALPEDNQSLSDLLELGNINPDAIIPVNSKAYTEKIKLKRTTPNDHFTKHYIRCLKSDFASATTRVKHKILTSPEPWNFIEINSGHFPMATQTPWLNQFLNDLAEHPYQRSSKIIQHAHIKLWTQVLSKNTQHPWCVLISGANTSAMFWSDHFCQTLIREGYQIIRFDHRELNLSDTVDWNNNPYTIADLADDILKILEYYQIQKAHLVGHAMGATIAQYLALHYPKKFSSFTAISLVHQLNCQPPALPIFQEIIRTKLSQNFETDLPEFLKLWNKLNGDYPTDPNLSWFYTKDLYLRTRHPVSFNQNHIRCQEQFSILAQLSNITVPGLYIQGKLNPIFHIEDAKKIQTLVPHSKMIIEPKMGHMLFDLSLEKKIARYLIKHFKINENNQTK